MQDQPLPAENVLEKYTHDLTALARQGRFVPLLRREKEVEQAFQVLARPRKNNPMLIGEFTDQRVAVVLVIARRVSLGEVPAEVQIQRIVALDFELLTVGVTTHGQFAERLKAVCEAVYQAEEKTVLFVDNFPNLVSTADFDVANILVPAFYRGKLRVIATATLDDYRKYIERDAALQRQFQEIIIRELTE